MFFFKENEYGTSEETVAARQYSTSLFEEIIVHKRMIFPHRTRIVSKPLGMSYTGANVVRPPNKDSIHVPVLRISVDNWFGERLTDGCQPFRSYTWENYMDLNNYCLRELGAVQWECRSTEGGT